MSLIKTIQGVLTGGPYYVLIRRDRLHVRDVSGTGVFDEEPLIAIEPSTDKVVAFGNQARMSGNFVNPLDHPRTLINDFILAEKLLNAAFRHVAKNKAIAPAPVAVIHPNEQWEGGLTQVELRALRELGEGAGARKVYLWEGQDLTDEQLLSERYLASAM